MKRYILIENEGVGHPDLHFRTLAIAKLVARKSETSARILDLESGKTVWRGYGYLGDRL